MGFYFLIYCSEDCIKRIFVKRLKLRKEKSCSYLEKEHFRERGENVQRA